LQLTSLSSTARIGFEQTADLKSGISIITDQSKNTDQKGGSRDDKCLICLCDFTDKKILSKCGHSFCAGCIDEAFKHQKKCPVCSQVYGPLIENQPPGMMIVSRTSISLSGYESCGSITIRYKIEEGVQGPEHPNPGKRYFGMTREAYLPDNDEGNKVLRLLQKAFDQKLTFTIGRSPITGATNVVTWNDIHHKTRRTGGATRYDNFTITFN
jgi:deltex-like protein